MISPQTPKTANRFAFLARYKTPDLMSSLNVIIGIMAVIILLIGAWIFVFYVYKPLFTPVESSNANRPSINHLLLKKLSLQVRQDQEILSTPLVKHYESPFRQMPNGN